MKLALTLVAAVAGSAAAFAPAQQSRSSSALAEKPFSDALGAMTPVSDGVFNPYTVLGVSCGGSRKFECSPAAICLLSLSLYLDCSSDFLILWA
jgi:hypothetical protein